MQINDKWMVESDPLNIILKHKVISKPKDGKPSKEYWVAEGYYRTLHDALEALIDKKIRKTELKDMQTICNMVDELKVLLKQIPDFKPIKEVAP